MVFTKVRSNQYITNKNSALLVLEWCDRLLWEVGKSKREYKNSLGNDYFC